MGSSIAMTQSSVFSLNSKRSYDVFLSFRGEDTRSNFTSHLHMALREKGVNVFIDDKLNRGEQISESLFRSIEGALISIVIFSKNYASSSWCLDELVKIIECKKFKGQIVWPIFYKVDPSDIRKQTGSFGEALATHQAKFRTKIPTWREALTIAANSSGFDLGTRKEADLIQDLVKEVLSILNHTCTPLNVARYPVGIDSQLKRMVSCSHYETQHESSTRVYMVGIYGMGGIGKTTLAKALYNKLANQFKARCFLSNVREASKQFNGLVQLQEDLLHEILNGDWKVGFLAKGVSIISYRLRSKKVLIVLDDVDELEQLEVLVGKRDWFGPGSKIIVTTRNKRLLSAHKFDQEYGIEGMNHDDALELFSWHAFEKIYPPSNYLNLSERATSYCKGHPLALVVLGSFLRAKYNQAEWKSILDDFENSLRKGIKDILQISIDGLEGRVKEIFLDISCLLVGEKVNYVKKILNACYLNSDVGIIELMDLSLITVDDNKVQMHDLIRQMGHKIVNDESSEPGKRSRLWLEEDVLKVFNDNSGTDEVKAIKLDLNNPTRLDVNPRAFRNMKNLRLLIVRNVRFSKKLKYLSNNLKWIKWHGFTLPSLPSCFFTKNLVGLDLQHSLIKNLGKRFKDCQTLKFVNLSYSTALEKISDFSSTSSLEELYLRECTNLRTLPKSIVSLGKLVILNLDHCSNLKKLPSDLMLKSLKVLKLKFCKKLEELPDFSAASNLEKLYLNECTNLRTLPKSIVSLGKLVILELDYCSNLKKLPSDLMLKSLKVLNLKFCKKIEELPDFSAASNLKELYLNECTNLRVVHESIGYLDNLVTLNLSNCTNLEKFPSYLRLKSLKELDLKGCCKFEMFPEIDENMKFLNLLNLSFTAIRELPSSIGYLTRLRSLVLQGCTNLFSLPTIIYLLPNLSELCLNGCSRLEMFFHKWGPAIHPVCSSSKPMFFFLSGVFLKNCNISNADFLETLCDVTPSLYYLDLSENKFSSLPSCLHKCKSLRKLILMNCKFLQEIPNLPQCITRMQATGSLARSPDNIVDIIQNKQNIWEIDRHYHNWCYKEFILMNGAFQKRMNEEIVERFGYQTISNPMMVSFRHNLNIKRTLAAYVTFKMEEHSYPEHAAMSFNIGIGNIHIQYLIHIAQFLASEYTWLISIPSSDFNTSLVANDWNDVIVWFDLSKCSKVFITIKSCGVHLTEVVQEMQNDVEWPKVTYTDFDQPEKLSRWCEPSITWGFWRY